MTIGRVCILLMDSLGVGASLDADKYGDLGANTFASIAKYKKLNIPNLASKGLYHAALASSGELVCDLASLSYPVGYFGYAVEQSVGKDTTSGHWELAGVPVTNAFTLFPEENPCFPAKLLQKFLKVTGLPGVLGQKHASGTEIIKEFGEEHIKTGKPIVYTSADSVFQIAAHEEVFGLERLYECCVLARKILDDYNIGRVIARPFLGKDSAGFYRTGNRHDYSMPPPALTLLDYLKNAKREVISIGKIADIFAHQGLTKKVKADGNKEIFAKTIEAMEDAPDGSLVFANFVDFDSVYGHRRDIAGYHKALEDFDESLPLLDEILKENDLVVITADHGCDPTCRGSDHTREHIPVLMYGPKTTGHFIGRRDTFADVGQTIAQYLQIEPLATGIAFLDERDLSL